MAASPTRVSAPGAPAPLGPYPHAVVARGLVFCSGQGARDPESGVVAGLQLAADGRVIGHDARVMTEACLDNVERVLAGAGATLADVVELQVFLVDMDDFAAMNEVYARRFAGGGPARTTVGVASLPAGNYVEMRAVAVAPDGKEEAR